MQHIFRSKWIPIWGLIVAFILRLYLIPYNPMWFDEMLEYWLATAPYDQLLQATQQMVLDPPLYSFLLHTITLVSNHEFVLKGFSVVCSTAYIAIMYLVIRHISGKLSGMISIAIMIFLQSDVIHAVEVNQYALLVFLLAVQLYMFLQICTGCSDKNTSKWWILLTISSILAIYTHYGASIYVLTIWLMLFIKVFREHSRLQWGRFLGSGVFVFGCILPLMLFFLPEQLSMYNKREPSRFEFSWSGFEQESQEIWSDTQAVFAHFIQGNIFDEWKHPIISRSFWIYLFTLLVVSGVILLLRQKQWYLLGSFLSLWVLYIIIGRVGIYPYDGSRYALILSPYFLICCTLPLGKVIKIQPYIGIGVTLVVTMLIALMPHPPIQDMPSVVTQWFHKQQRSESQIPTYVMYGATPAFRYQYNQIQQIDTSVLPYDWYVQCWSSVTRPDFCQQDEIIYGAWTRSYDSEKQRAYILDQLPDDTINFWLIISHSSSEDEIVASFTEQDQFYVDTAFKEEGASAYLLVMNQ